MPSVDASLTNKSNYVYTCSVRLHSGPTYTLRLARFAALVYEPARRLKTLRGAEAGNLCIL